MGLCFKCDSELFGDSDTESVIISSADGSIDADSAQENYNDYEYDPFAYLMSSFELTGTDPEEFHPNISTPEN
jgi:hypothetical protein